MQTIKIILLKSDVLAAIASNTSYTGTKTESANPGEFYDRVATVEKDAELLSLYWQDTCASLADALRTFIVEAKFGRETLTLTLEVSNSYDATLTPAVETGISAVVVAAMISRWFRITMPQRAAEWEKEATRQFEALLANLYHRKKPVRK